jgi:hypothetical protein
VRQTPLSVCSRLVVLDIRPLSAYQQQLVETVFRLRSLGGSDRQIANHLNAAGTLTPRGRRWVAQSVTSVRIKSLVRSARLDGTSGRGDDFLSG